MLTMKRREITILDAKENFAKYNFSKGLAERTVKYYNCAIQRFISFMEKDDFRIDDITQDDIMNFTISLRKRDMKTASINSFLTGFRAFINYCISNFSLEKVEVKLVKQERTIKETYSEDELKVLLKKPNIKKCEFCDYRNWVIINYLLSTGNRLSTVINVKICDLDLKRQTVILRHTKNKTQQIIPLSTTMCRILLEYLSYRGGNDDSYLFCTVKEEQFTTEGFYSTIKRYNNRLGIKKTSIHMFRHTYAKMFIMAGGDAFRLQQFLGHSDMTITRNYVNMFGTDLQLNYDMYNPLEQISHNQKDNIKMR